MNRLLALLGLVACILFSLAFLPSPAPVDVVDDVVDEDLVDEDLVDEDQVELEGSDDVGGVTSDAVEALPDLDDAESDLVDSVPIGGQRQLRCTVEPMWVYGDLELQLHRHPFALIDDGRLRSSGLSLGGYVAVDRSSQLRLWHQRSRTS